MDIWLDTTLPLPYSNDECNTLDSDGPCPTESSGPFLDSASIGFYLPIASTLSEEDVRYLHTHTFVYPKTLNIQKCYDSLWFVCNPTESGRVVVLDAQAHALLEDFQVPKVLHDAIQDSPASALSIARAIMLFSDLGILQDLDQPRTAVNQEQHTLAAWLHVTNACNLSCHYCYVRKSSEHMADDTLKRAVDAIMRSAISYQHQSIYLTYAGGEATLRLPQVLATHDYALQEAQARGLHLSATMISNGAALPPHAIDELKQRQIQLMISLDGVGEAHDRQRPLLNGNGSFKLVDRTITRLLTRQLVPYINVTVTQRNLNDLPGLLGYLLERDLPFGLSYYRDNECSTHLSDLPFTDAEMISGMRTAFAYIEEHLPKRSLLSSLVDKARTHMPHSYTCGVGRNYLVIDQQGGVAKCQADLGHTVTTIDVDNPLRVIREDRHGVQAVAVEDKEGCRSCEWRFWCSGGCPMLTYRLTGRSDIKSPNCAIYKALFPDAVRLEALRLLRYERPFTL